MPKIPAWLSAEVQEYRLPFIKAPKSIADIGANIGAFTLMAKAEWPRAGITAFEPFKANFETLRGNVSRIPAGCRRMASSAVSVVHAAVRSFTGSDKIFVGDMGVTCGFHQLGRQTAVREKVNCVDARSIGSFEFVKIDTEGCELEILRSLDLSKTKAIALEYHRSADVAPIKKHAKSRGFSLWLDRPHGANVGILVFAREGVLQLRQIKLFVAMPCFDSMPPAFVKSLIAFVKAPPCSIVVKFVEGDSLVPRARNSLTADFLASDCTHILFLDTDLIFSTAQVARMISHGEPIVGGFYPKKQQGQLEWVCNAFPNKKKQKADARGLHRLRYIGTGFLLVDRRVFEKMKRRLGYRLWYNSDTGTRRREHDFWSVGVHQKSRRYLSEDWYFCQRALDLGYPVFGDTRVIVKHIGRSIFPLKSQEHEIRIGV